MGDDNSKKACVKYCTGSMFYGNLDEEGKPSGFGFYRYPNGIEYHGQFLNGVFHGRGMLLHPTKFKMCGEFINGKCVEHEFYFGDGLKFEEHDWKYCQHKDRRFWLEIVRGIPPVGLTFHTKEKPSRRIPPGMYDAGEGYFDPTTGYIYDVDTRDRIRYVCPQEQRKILRQFRMNEDDYVEQQARIAANKFKNISTDSCISDDDP